MPKRNISLKTKTFGTTFGTEMVMPKILSLSSCLGDYPVTTL